jgi:hypothetical protein
MMRRMEARISSIVGSWEDWSDMFAPSLERKENPSRKLSARA